jgi:O-glycosyl hydrolase
MKKPWTNRQAWKVYNLATGDSALKKEFDAEDRKNIADEMRQIATAKTIKEAVAVIDWWLNSDEENLATVKAVRKAWREHQNG